MDQQVFRSSTGEMLRDAECSSRSGHVLWRVQIRPQLMARYLTANSLFKRDDQIGRHLLVAVNALPDTRLTRVASPCEFCLAPGQTHYLVNWSFCVRHVCVPQWIMHSMITQVIDNTNTCYLMTNNVCFTLAGMNKPSEMLKDRILERRTALGLSQAQLAEKSGVSQVTIQHLESGRNSTSKKLLEIARALGVTAEWLASGKGITHEASNVKELREQPESFRYPVISWVAAGAWAEAVEPFPPGYSDRYEMSDYDSKGAAFWLEVKGDSMTSPVGISIPEGMLILVDTEAEATPGKLVIAKLADSNEATFKKLVEDGGRRFLKPLNPAYPTEMCLEGCRIVGVVVRATMKL